MANVYLNPQGRVYQANSANSTKDSQLLNPSAELIAAAPAAGSPDFINKISLNASKVRVTNNPGRIS